MVMILILKVPSSNSKSPPYILGLIFSTLQVNFICSVVCLSAGQKLKSVGNSVYTCIGGVVVCRKKNYQFKTTTNIFKSKWKGVKLLALLVPNNLCILPVLLLM